MGRLLTFEQRETWQEVVVTEFQDDAKIDEMTIRERKQSTKMSWIPIFLSPLQCLLAKVVPFGKVAYLLGLVVTLNHLCDLDLEKSKSL